MQPRHRAGETLTGFRRRIRYWTALALLRCVMSSPAAAQSALLTRAERLREGVGLVEEGDDALFAPYVYDPTEDREETVDVAPAAVVEEGEWTLADRERRRLREFARRAEALRGSADDTKRVRLGEILEGLLAEGYQPIVWCRYIATSDDLAPALQQRLERRFPEVRAISVTGALTEDERRLRVDELAAHPRRVLVATDCLSEGINLQEHFNAVVHYDLPWNPNRLEQREGRVDRFGQNAPQVKAILLYGRDNPIDGAVLDVLLRKARQIHRTLRISVPVPTHSETVLEAVLQALFLRGQAEAGQRSLFAADEEALLRQVHLDWDRAADRERISRSRFAQRSIQPDEVQRELEETDQVLGDPQAVERFVRAACERLGAPLSPAPKAGPQRPTWYLPLTGLPAPLRERLPTPPRTRGRGAGEEVLRVIFDTPAPEGTVYIGRHHPFTGALAEYLLDAAFAPPEEETSRSRPPLAARGGVLRTDAVERRTTLLLLRLRYLLAEAGGENPLLAEEALVWGFRGRPGDLQWLPDEETMDLLAAARPTANVTPEERREVLEAALAALPDLEADLTARMEARAQALEQSHRRVRRSLPPLAKGRPGG